MPKQPSRLQEINKNIQALRLEKEAILRDEEERLVEEEYEKKRKRYPRLPENNHLGMYESVEDFKNSRKTEEAPSMASSELARRPPLKKAELLEYRQRALEAQRIEESYRKQFEFGDPPDPQWDSIDITLDDEQTLQDSWASAGAAFAADLTEKKPNKKKLERFDRLPSVEITSQKLKL